MAHPGLVPKGATLRRVTFIAMLLAFLILAVSAAPAFAGPQAMPPNEVAILKALAKQGRIPKGATEAQMNTILQQYLSSRLGAKAEDRANLGPANTLQMVNGRTPWGRLVAGNPAQTKDNILVILAEFSTSDYTDPTYGFFRGGPTHGQIAPPAYGDNATFYPGDVTPAHYQNMLFGSSFNIYGPGHNYRGTSTDTMRNYYLQMSKGTYLVGGTTTVWVRLPYPESYYGRNAANGDDLTGPVWRFARDAVAALAKKYPTFNWSKFDTKNPYGLAGSNPNVPDGVIDHLIVIHAGADESAGGGAQGPDAIWAHSWQIGGGSLDKAYPIPGTDKVAYNYTTEPEDGGIGVFCHEFGHDLGLPDEYDTSYVGESPSGFWTLMDSGSWAGRAWGLGTRPTAMNSWDKAALGFVKPITLAVGQSGAYAIQPAATGLAAKSAFKVKLPPALHTTVLSDATGTHPEWWSGMGNNLDNTITTTAAVAVPAGSPQLSFDTWYEIEQGYDYGYVEVSTDGGATWATLANGNTSSDGGGGTGFTGVSGGGGNPAWVHQTFDLSAYAGTNVLVRFEYWTDGGVAWRGWEVDNVDVAGVLTNTGTIDSAWTISPATGQQIWRSVSGSATIASTRYYIGEYRNQTGFDTALANVYNWRTDLGVEWFKYNTGMLLIYADNYWPDNNTGEHPGYGAQMVVDSHPWPDYRFVFPSVAKSAATSTSVVLAPWRSRIQSRDAAFSYLSTPAAWLTPMLNVPDKVYLPSRPGQSTFDDALTYWFSLDGDAGTQIDHLGVRIHVSSLNSTRMIVKIKGAQPSD